MVSRPVGISTAQQRDVELEKTREKQRSIERGQRLLELQNEFDREGMIFTSNAPIGTSEQEVIHNLEAQLQRRKEQRVRRPNFDAVQSQGHAPLSRQIEAGLFGAVGVAGPLIALGGAAGEAVGSAAAGLVVNPQETRDEVRRRGGSVFNPVDLAGAAHKAAPGPALVGELAGGAVGSFVTAAPKAAGKVARVTANQFRPPKSAGIAAREAPETTESVKKLTNALRETKFLREGVEEARSAELSDRAARIAQVQANRGLTPDQRLKEIAEIQKGKLPSGTFDLGEEVLSPGELISMRNAINFSRTLKPFDKTNLEHALLKVMGADFTEDGTRIITGKGTLPQPAEIRKLGEFFGDDFASALLKHRSLGDKAYENFVDALNLPRVMLASFGIDALRQGAPVLAAHPRASFRAFNAAWKAARDPEVARQLLIDLEKRPGTAMLKANGLELTRFGRNATRTDVEEGFVSRWGQIFPWVRVSERANVAFFNTLRSDIGEGILREWNQANLYRRVHGQPVKAAAEQLKDVKALANFLNIATGRGGMGQLKRASPFLNAFFFSPRLIASRFQLPFTALTRSHAVRKQIARDLSIFVGTNVGILAFLKAAGGDEVDVELNPKSSDFGQLKIGAQRVDFWGGMRQIAVLAARLSTGESKSIGTGTILSQSQKDTLVQFFRFKLSPQAAAVTDFLTDETALGEELGVDNQVFDRLFPLVVEDMKDAFEEQGLGGAAVSSFSLIGLNSNTFLTTQDIVNPLLETTINVQAQDGTGRITDITDSRLTPVQKSQVLSRPDVQEALLAESRRTKQDQLQIERNARKARRITNDFRLANGEVDGKTWRNDLLTARLVSGAVSETRQSLTGSRPTSKPRNENERALNGYFDLIDAHRIPAVDIDLTTLDPTALTPEDRAIIAKGFDVSGFSTAVDVYLSGLSEKQRDYVLTNTHPDRTPVENLYYEAQGVLKPYWDVPDKIIQSPQLRALYDEYVSLPGNAQREFARRNPAVKRAVDRVSTVREKIRKSNREIDDMLIAFYGGAATHRANTRESRNGLLISRTRQRIFSQVDERLAESTGVR